MTERPSAGLRKRETGIPGLDQATRGGLPAAGAVLIVGDPGCGKTVLGLNILARAAERGEGGLFLTFEESREQLFRDADSFTWGRTLRETDRCELLDVRSMPRAEGSGAFDIDGFLSVVEACAERLAARWVALDGIDRLLGMHDERARALEQIAQINDWSEKRGITLLLTGKSEAPGAAREAAVNAGFATRPDRLEGIEYLLSTTLVLSGWVIDHRLNRRLRIAKYRGTGHQTDEMALLIDSEGIHLPYGELPADPTSSDAPEERISTGVERLDEVLGGGLYRGSTTLISGQPGTAKTTLAMSFAEATARREERVLYVSFDEYPGPILRNARSVGIDLRPHVDRGLVRLHARAAWVSQLEEHYLHLMREIEAHDPRCLVIDPVSALLKSGRQDHTALAVERLLAYARVRGMTTVLTSLSESDDPVGEKTLSHTSTIADTWIMLRYQVLSGERNRSLSVVKSRGTGHSNQVRELVLSSQGVQLADVYGYRTEVLMGTARAQREIEEEARRSQRARESERRRLELEREVEEARLRAAQAQTELTRLSNELQATQEENRADEAYQAHLDEQV